MNGGTETDSRYCTKLRSDVVCCLPCPYTQWVFSDHFHRTLPVANYISVVSFICALWLLLTFAVLQKHQTHRSYLSVGLVISMIMLALAFIIPLGVAPEKCFDGVTPNNMQTDATCAWTGALLEAGAMGIVVWSEMVAPSRIRWSTDGNITVFLRAAWTVLRAVFDVQRDTAFRRTAIIVGSVLPILLLSITMPLTGVSYRLGDVCLPNNRHASRTWFAWLFILAGLGSILQVWTVLYCCLKFTRSRVRCGSTNLNGSQQNTWFCRGPSTHRDSNCAEHLEWQRVKLLLTLQWRTILLTFIIINVTIYFAVVFNEQDTILADGNVYQSDKEIVKLWMDCLIASHGDKDACLHLSPGIGLSEARTLGTMMLTAVCCRAPLIMPHRNTDASQLLGPIILALMVRREMFAGWWHLLRATYALMSQRKVSRVASTLDSPIYDPTHQSVNMVQCECCR